MTLQLLGDWQEVRGGNPLDTPPIVGSAGQGASSRNKGPRVVPGEAFVRGPLRRVTRKASEGATRLEEAHVSGREEE